MADFSLLTLSKHIRQDRSYPLYHTMHETMHLVDLIDPNFVFHQAVGRMWGEMGRYLADSVLVPFNVTDYGRAMVQYVDDLTEEVAKSPAASSANISELGHSSFASSQENDRFVSAHIQEAAKAFLRATESFDANVSSMMDRDHYE